MTRILITDAVDERYVGMLRAVEGFTVDFRNGIKADELSTVIGNYDCIIVRSRTKLTEQIVSKATSAKLIVRAGVGTDNIDVKAATAMGIAVCNTPWANVVSAAELAMGLMLSISRKICDANTSMHSGKWETLRFTGAELSGKRLGIIGLGRVGREVAKRALAFQMEVVAADPYIRQEVAEGVGVKLVDLNTLLSTADIVTIHASMMPGNMHLIGGKELALMKKTALLINTARGEMVDSAALADALKAGRIAGAGCDVYEGEPAVNQSLAQLDSIVMTPHVGAQTKEAQGRVGAEVVEVVDSYFSKGRLMNAVNGEALNSKLAP